MTMQYLESESAQLDYAWRLAQACASGLVIYLQGPLGAGKTTFARGFLRGLGHAGKVKSPTYTLLEEYLLDGRCCFHFDLYRLSDPEELEFMGIRDFTLERDILLIEWPDRGAGFLPQADLLVDIDYARNGRSLVLKSLSDKGNAVLNQSAS